MRSASPEIAPTAPAQPPSRLVLVVPCYNEEDMLPAFFATVIPAVDRATDGRWRIICVDDGSRDATFSLVARQNSLESRVVGISLSRNFGHQAAVSAGLAYASGEYIAVVDCDLQDPVSVLLALYTKAQRENLDVCYGIRQKRDAPVLLKLGYHFFYRLIRRAAEHDWPLDAGDFCVMSARCHRALLSLPEHSRMMRGLRSWVGFRQSGIPYRRPARSHGATKYNMRKLAALAIQGLIAFSSVPLRLATIIGTLMGLFSILFAMMVLINRLFPRFTFFHYWVGANPGVATLLVFLALVFSVGFLCLGLIGEYLIVLLQEAKRRPTAVVATAVGYLMQNAPAYDVIELPATRANCASPDV